MKFVRESKHSTKMNKDVLNIDDWLLLFKDSGDVIDYNVSLHNKNVRIYLEFNKNLVGIDKIHLLDRIIHRLKRKYSNIIILNDIMWVALKPDVFEYLSNDLIDEIDKIFENNICNLKIQEIENKILFSTESGEVLIQISEDNLAVISDKILDLFRNKFMLYNKDTLQILKDKINKYFNLSIKTTTSHPIIFDFSGSMQ